MKLPIIFAIATAICWGLYGPILQNARSTDPDQSPFKPYVAIGVAYLVWAVLGGIVGMTFRQDSFKVVGPSGLWGLAAGTLGAWGALTLTLAMSGPVKMPHVVMPIVFGGAVTVSAIYVLVTSHGHAHASPMLWVGIAGMLVSVVLIASNAPHAAPAKAPTSSATKAASSQPTQGTVESKS